MTRIDFSIFSLLCCDWLVSLASASSQVASRSANFAILQWLKQSFFFFILSVLIVYRLFSSILEKALLCSTAPNASTTRAIFPTRKGVPKFLIQLPNKVFSLFVSSLSISNPNHESELRHGASSFYWDSPISRRMTFSAPMYTVRFLFLPEPGKKVLIISLLTEKETNTKQLISLSNIFEQNGTMLQLNSESNVSSRVPTGKRYLVSYILLHLKVRKDKLNGKERKSPIKLKTSK